MSIFLSILVVLGAAFGLTALTVRLIAWCIARSTSNDKTAKAASVKKIKRVLMVFLVAAFGFLLVIIFDGVAVFAPTEKILVRQVELTATRTTDFLYNEGVKSVLIYKDGRATDVTAWNGDGYFTRYINDGDVETAVVEEYILRTPEGVTRYIPFVSFLQEGKTIEIRVPPGTVAVRLIKLENR